MVAGKPHQQTSEILADRLRDAGKGRSPALRRVLSYIDTHRSEVLSQSAVEIANAAKTSDAAVVRAVQTPGFSGLPSLKAAISQSLGKGQTPAENMTRTLEELQFDIKAGSTSSFSVISKVLQNS